MGEIFTSLDGEGSKFVLSDDIVLVGSQDGSHRVSGVGAVVPVGERRLCVVVMVETAGEHLLGKGHEIGPFPQIPLLVGPEGARLTNTSLHLVDNEVDSKLFGDVLEALSEFSGELVVSTL